MIFNKVYKGLMLEFSEGAIRRIIQKFQNDASEEEIRREVQDFERYKNSLTLKDPFQYKSWLEFTEAIHAAKGKSEFKKRKAPSAEITADQSDIIADDENVTIYRGDSQDKCILYGKGYTFCISRPTGGNMYNNYRLSKDSSFYFIYFKKKPKSQTDHIMVLDHTKNGYEWTFADNNTKRVMGGLEEVITKYPELSKYKDLFTNKKLDDDEKNFISRLQEFNYYPTLENFNKFSYKEQANVLKSIYKLDDDIWKTLDGVLRNEFINIGPNLTPYQVDDLTSSEINRYKKTRIQTFDMLSQNNLLTVNKLDPIEKIATDPRYSYEYALNLKGQNVPEIIIKRIVSDPVSSYKYATYVLNGQNVPEIFIKGISTSAEYSYDYAFYLKGQNVPEIIIKGIATHAGYSYKYATEVLKGQNVPEIIIKGIATNSWYSYKYATDVLNGQNVPEIIIKGIATDARNSYSYAFYLKGQNVPEIIIKSIATSAWNSFEYVTEVLKGQNVPEIFLKSIATSAWNSFEYVTEVLKGQNVPEIFLKSIATSAMYSYGYARNVLKGQNVPEIILKGIATSAEYSYDYATEVLKGQNVPEIIIKGMRSYKSAYEQYLLQLASLNLYKQTSQPTVKESFIFDQVYYNMINRFL